MGRVTSGQAKCSTKESYTIKTKLELSRLCSVLSPAAQREDYLMVLALLLLGQGGLRT